MPIFSAGSASVSIVPDFSGAQKAIGEWFARQSDIHVKVHPDLDNGDVARTEAELNAMHGSAKVEVDRNFLSSSIASGIAEAMSRSGLDRLGGLLTAAIGPTVITAIGGAFVELAAAASQAIGIVALLPAGLAALAVPAATLMIGFQGVGAAIKDAFDPKKAAQFQAAMDKLAPSAQSFVREIVALKPAWDSLRLDVQQALFAGIGTAVANLASVALPILHTGLTQVATAMNGGLLATMTALSHQGAAFTTLFSNIAASIHVANGAAAPLISAFMTLASIGSQFLPGLAQGFVNVATAFNNWIQHIAATGQLVAMIQNAITVITQLGQLALNVGRIVVGIFQAAMGPGALLLGLLIQVTGQLATFIHSADGQAALSGFFTSIQRAMATVLPALSTLVQAIVTAVLPAIGQFAALLAPIAATLLTQLASGLIAVSQIVPPLVQVMAALISALAPLIPIVTQIIITLLPPLVALFGQLAPIISQVSAVLGQALLAAAQAIAPILPVLSNALLGILNAILPLVPQAATLATAILPPLGQAFLAVVAAITPLVPYLVQIVRELLPPLAAILQALIPIIGGAVSALGPILQIFLAIVNATVLPLLVNLLNSLAAGLNVLAPVLGPLAGIVLAIVAAVKLWTIAQAALDIALDANPIGIIILAIGALVIAIGEIVTHLGALKTAWNDTWAAIKAIWDAVWGWISASAVASWTAISSFYINGWNSFTAAWQNFLNAVFSFFQNLWNTLVSWAQNTWNALAGWFTNAWSAFTQAWQNFLNAVFSFFQNLWNTLVAWIENVWTALAGWLANAWNAYTTAWQSFWNAVLSFFQNLWNSLVSWIESVWSSLASWFTNAWNAFTQAWQNFWNSVFSFFQNLWNSMVGWVQNTWNTLSGWFSGALNAFSAMWGNIWSGVSSTFQAIWNGIKGFAQQVWNDIKAIIAAPVNFVIGTILNGGLFRAWNAVNDFLHLPFHINNLPLIPGFVGGGYTGDTGLFGTGAREDPAGVVHAREFVFTSNQVDAAGGPDAMYGLAAQLDRGYSDGGHVDPALGTALNRFPGYIGGGVVTGFTWEQLWNIVHGAFPNAVRTSDFRPGANDFHGAGEAIDVSFGGNPQSLLMPLAAWIASHYPNSTELIHNPNESIKNGQPVPASFWGAATWAEHANHVHWAMTPAALAGAPGGGAGGGVLSSVMSVLGSVLSSAGDVLGFLKNSISGGIGTLLGMKGGNWLQILAGLPPKLVDGLWGIVKDKVGSFFTSFVNGGPVSTGKVQSDVQAIFNTRGWGTGAEWAGLDYIVSHESGWNPHAQNPTSTASGLFQMIDSTWAAYRPASSAAFAHMKDASTADQAQAGMRYIGARYGDPIGAQQFWAAHHFYDSGGWLPPGYSSVYNGTGGFEAVLNRAQQDSITNALSRRSDAPPTWHFYLGDQEITDLIDTRVVYHSDRDGRAIRSSM